MKESAKKILERIGWILTAAGVVALFIAGVSAEEVAKEVALIDTAVLAVGAVITFIFTRWKAKK